MTEQEWLTSTDPAAMLQLTTAARPRPKQAFARYPIWSERKLRLFAVACCRYAGDGVPCWACAEDISAGIRPAIICRGRCRNGRIGELTDPIGRAALEVSERYADGLVTKNELYEARYALHTSDAFRREAGVPRQLNLYSAVWYACLENADAASAAAHSRVSDATQAALLRDIIGNPFRPVNLCGNVDHVIRHGRCGNCQRMLMWKNDAIPLLAQSIYDDRAFDRLPILADALEEAGCEDAAILEHCRPGGDWFKCRGCGTVYCHIHKYSDCGNARCEGEVSDPVAVCAPGPHARGCWVIDSLRGKE